MGNAPIWRSFLLRLQHTLFTAAPGALLVYTAHKHTPTLRHTLSHTHSHTLRDSNTHLAGTLAGTLELAHTLREEANNLRFWPVHIITTNVAGEAQAASSRQQATFDRTARSSS